MVSYSLSLFQHEIITFSTRNTADIVLTASQSRRGQNGKKNQNQYRIIPANFVMKCL